ncbi:MAG: hypothetical protein SF052_07500 [Bacteroidia bacterium]|nr:hypothetical protein [Bacteroidia bacterium]
MKILTIFILLCGAGGYVHVFAQPKPEYERVIVAAIKYPELKKFFEKDTHGKILLDVIVANNRIPQTGKIHVWRREIGIIPEADSKKGYALEIQKIRIRTDKAHLIFRYNQSLKARFHLRYIGDHWAVTRSSLQLRKTDENGQKIRRFYWGFQHQER